MRSVTAKYNIPGPRSRWSEPPQPIPFRGPTEPIRYLYPSRIRDTEFYLLNRGRDSADHPRQNAAC